MNSNRIIILLLLTVFACSHPEKSSHKEMVKLLAELSEKNNRRENEYANTLRAQWYEQQLKEVEGKEKKWTYQFEMGKETLNAGFSKKAVEIFSNLKSEMEQEIEDKAPYFDTFYTLDRHLALAYLRVGEQANCIHHHSATSCLLPVQNEGIHEFKTGSENAAEIYLKLLSQKPNDKENKWLLNLAHQTLGTYPDSVPTSYRINPLLFNSHEINTPIFKDIAPQKGLGVNQLSGGSVIEDFNNDGVLDIMASSWGIDHQVKLFLGNKDFTYDEITEEAGLLGITGGLNMMQTDYNNDGFLDVFILRGAWRGKAGHLPNSLLKNNGNGTFTDVSVMSGLLSMRPTQAAVWRDFNNDGWIDVFIANETYDEKVPLHAQLFINKGNGTFEEKAKDCGANVTGFFKGVTATDYDKDGYTDVFISNLEGEDFLLKNKGINEDGLPQFENVTQTAGLTGKYASFPCWFFDFNQDGWEDLMVFSLNFRKRNALKDAIADFLEEDIPTDKARLYQNNGDGTFREVSEEKKVNRVILAMGSNFGDIDNDGYPDFYAGTGTPSLNTVIPNRMFRNIKGEQFEEITYQSRTAHIQKGHGVSFGDVDADGDLDIHITMGGAVEGDIYPNALFENQLQNENNWIKLKLIGSTSNKAAIGSKIEITGTVNGQNKRFFKTVNSGGSFGASPLQQHVGINQIQQIDTLRIKWQGTKTVQEFYDVEVNNQYQLEENTALKLITRNKGKIAFKE